MMRILHTSDWHLGKRLFKLDRTQEHEFFLNWLLQTLKEKDIDLLLIAGDVFDSPTPPHQSLSLFYDFLFRVSSETKTDTLIIAGNHDSGLLLEAPAQLLTSHRVKVWGKLSSKTEDHWLRLEKRGEILDVCAIPFFRSYELLPQGNGDAVAALKTYLNKEKKEVPQLLMLHHLAGMYEAAGSEQVISLSGVDSIPTDILRSFDYVALGHIHKPQRMGNQVYYSGSPLALRFSETHPKSVVLIEAQAKKLSSELLPIPSSRSLHVIKATLSDYKEKINALKKETKLTPMVEVQLTLPSPQVGLLDEIKDLLAKKDMELLSFLPFYQGQEKKSSRHEKLFELSPLELFEEFYATKFPESPEIPHDLKEDFMSLHEKVKHASRPT